MKKSQSRRRLLRKSLLVLVVAVMSALSSCKQESSDVSSLLSTVPSSSGMVVGVNLKSVLEKSGCVVDGSSIKAGKEVQEWLDGLSSPGANAEMLRLFLNGDSGIDPQGMVIFTDAYNSYATAMIADTDKFISFVEKQTGGQFSEAEGGVKVCNNVAINGAQMWLCWSSVTTIDAKAIKNYATLSENQSFLTKNVSEPIAEMKTDIAGWADISTLAKNMLSMGEMAQLNLAVGALFQDPASVAVTIDCGKGKMEGHLCVLNDKGDNAKFLLPTKKVDVDLVKGIGGTADILVAGCITKDFTKKVERMLSSFGGNLFSEYTKAIAQIDGTVGVACGVRDNGKIPVNGFAQTDGDPGADVMNFLSQFGSTKKDGDMVRFSEGTVSGALDVENTAAAMKGAWLAAASSMAANDDSGLKTIEGKLVPDDGGLRLDVTVTAKDNSKNILLTVLKDFSKRSAY